CDACTSRRARGGPTVSRPVNSMLIVELVAVLVVGCTLATWIRRGMARIDALRAEPCRAL
ncbi:MAG: hypothetical protein OXU81_09950, partial [Gammaproteobacteria bacterium]|nr:hypothetical protein [Gammaproteobacteria bacterium]